MGRSSREVRTPFDRFPKALFVKRMLGPISLAFFVGLFMLGAITGTRTVKERVVRSPDAMQVSTPVLRAAGTQIAQTFEGWFSMPGHCWSGNTLNNLQKERCSEQWSTLFLMSLLALLPFALAGMFFWFAYDQVKLFYRRSGKCVQKGKAWSKGKVTDPAEAPVDFFSWWYCLRPIRVQLSDKKQVTVYQSYDSAVPLPGQTMAIFEGGNALGAKRFVGLHYAPHMAVISGSRAS